jgi:hypothetical protein
MGEITHLCGSEFQGTRQPHTYADQLKINSSMKYELNCRIRVCELYDEAYTAESMGHNSQHEFRYF